MRGHACEDAVPVVAVKANGRRTRRKRKCEAASAVGALDPGVPYESRWAPYVRIHGPGQGQFPKGSIRPRGYMAPDAQSSFARTNVTTKRPNRQRQRGICTALSRRFNLSTTG